MLRKLILFPVVCALCVLVIPVVGYGQDGAPDYETIDPERERYERERAIASPGEGDYHYTTGGGTIPTTTTNPSATTAGSATNPTTTTPKDSVAANQPAVKDPLPTAAASPRTEPSARPVDKQVAPRGDDESILSFNFLYYIIQKYKLQDIID